MTTITAARNAGLRHGSFAEPNPFVPCRRPALRPRSKFYGQFTR